MTRSQRQSIRCEKELGISSGERRMSTPPKSSDLLIGKRVLVMLAGRKTRMGLETEEILAMDNVKFPPPPPIGDSKKRNMIKFVDTPRFGGYQKWRTEKIKMDGNAIVPVQCPRYSNSRITSGMSMPVEGFRRQKNRVDRWPRKEPMQLDDLEERRQLDKGRKPPKSSVEE
ncbi:hypothetical protein Tco_1235459 [Tanacetum coccineum]